VNKEKLVVCFVVIDVGMNFHSHNYCFTHFFGFGGEGMVPLHPFTVTNDTKIEI